MSAPSIAGNLKSPFFPKRIEEDEEGLRRKPRRRGERGDDDDDDDESGESEESEEEETPAEIQSLLMPMRRYLFVHSCMHTHTNTQIHTYTHTPLNFLP